MKNTVLVFFCAAFFNGAEAQIKWTQILPGLRFAEAELSEKSLIGDSRISILEADPTKFKFHLITATENDRKRKPLDVWCREKKLMAGINAGLFLQDKRLGKNNHLLSAGYMRNFNHINQAVSNPYSSWIAFNPVRSGLPAFRIFDATCDDVSKLNSDFSTLFQGNTLLDCKGQIRWETDGRKFSMVLLGMDGAGHCFMMHCRSPYHPAKLAAMLLKILPSLQNLVYLEGGSFSSFFLETPPLKKKLVGSYQSKFSENDRNRHFLPLPNVLGISR